MEKISPSNIKASSHRKKIRISDIVLKSLIFLFSFITIGVLVLILAYVISQGISHINWSFISDIYNANKGKYGIFPMIVNTVLIVLLTVVIAAPVGICSAIYLVEYSKPGKIVSLIRFTTESLAGIPSIIYGIFGFIFFGITMNLKFSLLSGAFTLSIMVLPTIIRTTEESLKAVPISFKEGSLALGATKLTTIARVILPCAIPGILTAVILSVGRIVGETAALIFTFGQGLDIVDSPFRPGSTLSVHLYILSTEGLSLKQAFATATILIIVVALINLASTLVASRIKKLTIGVKDVAGM